MGTTLKPRRRIQHVEVGESVEVLCAYDGEWIAGFVVIELRPDGCRVQRSFDQEAIPVPLALDRIRPSSDW